MSSVRGGRETVAVLEPVQIPPDLTPANVTLDTRSPVELVRNTTSALAVLAASVFVLTTLLFPRANLTLDTRSPL